MTVSPTGPSDGSCHRRSRENSEVRDHQLRRTAPEGNTDVELSPPVLFELPNLNPVSIAKKADLAAAANASPVATGLADPEPTVLATGVLEGATAPARPNSSAFGSRETAAAMPTATADAAISESPIRNASADPIDPAVKETKPPVASGFPVDGQRPAGRTWMEAISAHKTVLCMLTLVVVVALWTSRRPSSTVPTDTSLAEIGDEVEMGTLDIELGDLESHTAVATTTSEVPPSEPLAAAMLKTPQSFDGVSTAPPATSVREPSSGLRVSAVSSRTSTKAATDLPSLEDLAATPDGMPASDTAANADPAESVATTFSETPNAVADWLQYLPPAPEYAQPESPQPGYSTPGYSTPE